MKRLDILIFALELYQDTAKVTKVNVELSTIKVGGVLTLTVPNEYIVGFIDDGAYNAVIKDEKLHLLKPDNVGESK